MGQIGKPEFFAHCAQACIENTYLTGVDLPINGGAVVALI